MTRQAGKVEEALRMHHRKVSLGFEIVHSAYSSECIPNTVNVFETRTWPFRDEHSIEHVVSTANVYIVREHK